MAQKRSKQMLTWNDWNRIIDTWLLTLQDIEWLTSKTCNFLQDRRDLHKSPGDSKKSSWREQSLKEILLKNQSLKEILLKKKQSLNERSLEQFMTKEKKSKKEESKKRSNLRNNKARRQSSHKHEQEIYSGANLWRGREEKKTELLRSIIYIQYEQRKALD